MLLYPPGRMFQRSEDRCQGNMEASAAGSVHACNDLGYAAAVLLAKGYEVFLRDYQTENASFYDVEKDMERFAPDMVFISTTNGTVIEDIVFIERLKENWDFYCVIKGAIFYDADISVLTQLKLESVDCMVGTEIETVIGDIADSIFRDGKKLSQINGIIYSENGELKKNAFGCWESSLDSIPFPARQLMNNALYVRPDTGEPMATIQVSRGCPAQCIYCMTPIISGRNVRFRSVENVFAEIEECYDKYGIKNFFFKADTFTINREWAIRLCDKIIASPMYGKIQFTANSRTKPLDTELLKKMKQTGCFMIAVGFESGSDETMLRIKKGASVADSLMAAQMIKEAGIPLFGFFVIGFPWETEKMIKETKKLIFRISPDFIELHIAMPYYGTELYEECRRTGTLNAVPYGCDYYSPDTSGTAFVSSARLQELKRNMLFSFYFRPAYIAKKTAECIKRPRIFANYARYALRLFKNNLLRH